MRTTRSRHIRLAELVALEVAVENDDPDLAPQDIRRMAIRLAIRDSEGQSSAKMNDLNVQLISGPVHPHLAVGSKTFFFSSSDVKCGKFLDRCDT